MQITLVIIIKIQIIDKILINQEMI